MLLEINKLYKSFPQADLDKIDVLRTQYLQTNYHHLYHTLDNSQIILSGFSQGCMISINLGLICNQSFKSVIGFSGKIIDKHDLQKRIISRGFGPDPY